MHRLLTCLLLFFTSLAAYSQRETPEQYIDKYKQLAIDEMRRSGVPAAITLAQGILESESGNSDLVKMSNNHFGIKCKSGWTGPTVSHDDDAPGECFRAYDQAAQSYEDHSDFLRNSPRYASLFTLNPDDYKGWATGLKKAGYATNPRYADILIASVEKYHLNQYTLDGMTEGLSYPDYKSSSATAMNPSSFSVKHNSGSLGKVQIIYVDKPVTGDIRQSDPNNNFRAVGGPSASSDFAPRIEMEDRPVITNANEPAIHVVEPREGLYSISKRFGVTVEQLKEWNQLAGDKLQIGQKLVINK